MPDTEVIPANIESVEQFLEECSDTDGCVYCIICYPHSVYPIGSIVPSLCGKRGPKYEGMIDQISVPCIVCHNTENCPECGMYIWLPEW